MRQDKTVARILLIFSAANVVLASESHAVVRQSHTDVAKAASEKRANSDDGTTATEPGSFAAANRYITRQASSGEPPSGSSRQDLAIASRGNKLENLKIGLHVGGATLAIIGAVGTIGYIIDKSIKAYSVPRDLPNGDVVDQGGKHHSRKELVSRGLANLRDEDLQLLDVLARRALESLV